MSTALAAASQPGILSPPLACGRSMTFRQKLGADAAETLKALRAAFAADWGVVGLGEPLVRALGREIAGLRTFPAFSGAAAPVPSTQQALWICLRGESRSIVFERSQGVLAALDATMALEDAMDTFKYADDRDLSGYLDGTANPKGEEGIAAALVAAGKGIAGSSFVAVQRWVHDLRAFKKFPQGERDAIIGRRLDTNDEIEDAPESSHVKRTEQESYDPPAFMMRRSLPWATAHALGLEFVAYASSLDPFARMMRRMAGLDDGIVDALFRFSRPITGGYYWCPPVAAAGRLDLSALGL
ncbi:MAG TPA: Dyp-type peroxidase [Stellaceae bacterium]|nr:Dyp-type peroxidase [Stellaceae bacterium]